MLKIAYQMGVQKALSEGDVNKLVKEAQELGIDLEKLGWGALLGGIGRGLSTGAKALGGGLKAMGGAVGRAGSGFRAGFGRGMQQGAGVRSALGRGLSGAGRQVGAAWKGLDPLQKKMMLGAGGAGLYAM
jgi:hypothetical protein